MSATTDKLMEEITKAQREFEEASTRGDAANTSRLSIRLVELHKQLHALNEDLAGGKTVLKG